LRASLCSQVPALFSEPARLFHILRKVTKRRLQSWQPLNGIDLAGTKRNELNGLGTARPMNAFVKEGVERETLHSCPACLGTRFSHFAVSDGFAIVRCAGCSLIFSNPRTQPVRTRRFFEEDYFQDQSVIDDNMTKHRLAPLRRMARLVRDFRPEGGRLLDIGAASGLFVSFFANDARWSPEGIEPSRNAASQASAKYGVPVHCGVVGTVALEENAYDAVTILDTFFLDPEPNTTIQVIGQILKPDGLVFFEIPGLKFRLLKNTGLVARIIYGNCAQLNPAMQLFYYEEKTLSVLLARHGFELAAKFPEQSPIYGGWFKRALNGAYFRTAAALFRLTQSRIHYAAKEVLVYKKAIA
jgi:2-polyprenyl-3-methyl-5-hydroxy-6-metoxy-1,4-benzoquinol methylase